ncbi:FAD dependent oxidoreductase, partial [Periconia macrospinosa]
GAGVIGSTAAFFLSHHESFDPSRGDKITLLEATKIAGGASGKAGGLLALWAYPSSIVGLSYRLHRELAEKHNGSERWGYRTVHCGQLDTRGVLSPGTSPPSKNEKKSSSLPLGSGVSLQKRSPDAIGLLRAAGVPSDLDWVAAEGVQGYEAMGDPTTTAQVHPYDFTTSMAKLAEEKGVEIIYGSATRIEKDAGKVTGVAYRPKINDNANIASPSSVSEESIIEAHAVILTAGPWTPTIYPSIPISALRAHSVTIRPSRPVSPYCLFTSIALQNSGQTVTATPEIYPRSWSGDPGDTLVPLPSSTAAVETDISRCDDIIAQVQSISHEIRDGKVLVKQACYLPNVDGRKARGGGEGPIIGESTKVKGLFVGAGHTCWGIQNAPATGVCLSELVWEGRVRSANVEGLGCRRFGI